MKNDLYNTLLDDFKKLSEEEKNAIFIYQSRLFYFINEITSISNYQLLNSFEVYSFLKDKILFEKKFNEYKSIVNKSQNLFFKMGIFQSVSFETLDEFINSLLDVIKILEGLENKILLKEEVTLYRGINVEDKNSFSFCKGAFVSTSLSLDNALEFIEGPGNPVLFKIMVDAPVSVIVSPYRIGLSYDSNISPIDAYLKNIVPTNLKMIAADYTQREIVLFSNKIDYEFISKKEIDHILVVEVNVKSKDLKHYK